ncbi:hypothetical protein EON65_38190 [archaeon]|nr:MAG: hypothetical protein EON65_38190 [archaeon]
MSISVPIHIRNTIPIPKQAVIVLEETKSRLAVARKDREVLMEQRKKEYRNAVVLENWLIERQRMKVR